MESFTKSRHLNRLTVSRRPGSPIEWHQFRGTRPLEGEVARPVVRFMQRLGDYKKCTIFDSSGMERSATPEECVGLERASVWDAWHIEERLLDTFMGRPNQIEVRNRVRFDDS